MVFSGRLSKAFSRYSLGQIHWGLDGQNVKYGKAELAVMLEPLLVLLNVTKKANCPLKTHKA